MKKWSYIRKFLILISITIFVIQSIEALVKYFKSPTVIINSETTWDNIEKPRIIALSDIIKSIEKLLLKIKI